MAWLVVVLAIPAAAEEATPAPAPQKHVICRVNGHDIYASPVREEMEKLLPWSSYHGNVPVTKREALLRQALQTVITRELEYQDAQRRHWKVSKREINKRLKAVMKRYPDEESFYAKLRATKFTVDDVKAELRRRALIDKAEKKVADADRKVSEAEARHYYEAHLERFHEPKRAIVREIVIKVPILGRNEKVWGDAKKRADEVFTRVESGEPFVDVVRLLSDAPGEEKEAGGLLGTLHQGRLSPKLDEVVWTLRPGQISRPIRTLKGYYLLLVDQFLPGRQVPFSEVKEKLRKQLQESWARERVTQWRADLRAQAKVEYLVPDLKPVAGEAAPAAK